MKAARYGLVVATLAFVSAELATAQAPRPQPGQKPTPGTTGTAGTGQPMSIPVHDTATIKDIETTLGFVPQWLREIPSTLLPSFWQSLKNFQLSTETKLDNKTKELIGLAVASTIPCEYCVAFHTEAARMNGATDDEIREAVGMASITREGSTLLNGLRIDRNQFRKDLDRMVRQRQQARR